MSGHDWRIGYYERLLAESTDERERAGLRGAIEGLKADPAEYTRYERFALAEFDRAH